MLRQGGLLGGRYPLAGHDPWGALRHLHLGSAVLQLLHVVDVLVGLHVDAKVPFGGGGVVAHVAAVGLVAARVHLTARQARVRLAGDTVDALGVRLRVFLLHVDLQRLLVLVVPVALGTLERLA